MTVKKFTTEQAAAVAGRKRRWIDGLIANGILHRGHRGLRRRYSTVEVLALAAMARLEDRGRSFCGAYQALLRLCESSGSIAGAWWIVIRGPVSDRRIEMTTSALRAADAADEGDAIVDMAKIGSRVSRLSSY